METEEIVVLLTLGALVVGIFAYTQYGRKHDDNPVKVVVQSDDYKSEELFIKIGRKVYNEHPPLNTELPSKNYQLTISSDPWVGEETKALSVLFTANINVPSLWSDRYDGYGMVTFTVDLDEGTIDREMALPIGT